MGLLDLWRKHRPAKPGAESGAESGTAGSPILSDDALRLAFVSTFVAGDQKRLRAFFRKHLERLSELGQQWQRSQGLPKGVTEDRTQLSAHVNALIWLAEALKQSGRPQLLDAMLAPGSNPIEDWNGRLASALKLCEGLHDHEATELLGNALIDFRELRGPGADHLQAKTHGLLGSILMHDGRTSEADPHLSRALQLCRDGNDIEGIWVYTGQLHELHRYTGDIQHAAELALEHADALERAGKPGSDFYRLRARRIRDGEPLLRVVALSGDAEVELDAFRPPADGKMRFDFRRNRPDLAGCKRRVERAVALARQNQQYEALELLREAMRIDPHSPEPHYKAGLTLLWLNRASEAADEYRLTDQLAPGWYECRGDLWLAEQASLGNLPHEVWMVLWALEGDGPYNFNAIDVLDNLEKAYPDLPHIHQRRAKILRKSGDKEAASAAVQRALSLAPECDLKSRLLLELGTMRNDPDSRRPLLEELLRLPPDARNLMAASMAQAILRIP
jgi:tetratricopeptide (TPR) repeat protein